MDSSTVAPHSTDMPFPPEADGSFDRGGHPHEDSGAVH